MLQVVALVRRRAFRLGLLVPLALTATYVAVLSSPDAASDDPRGCRLHSCPPPLAPHVTFTVSLDRRALPAVSRHSAGALHTYSVSVSVKIPDGAGITKYWLGSARGAWGVGGGPRGVHVLKQGSTLRDGSQVVFAWRPAGPGRESLVIVYDETGKDGPYNADAEIGDSLANFVVV